MSASIATQPAPSAGVAAFLRRPARLLIGGEWVQSESSVRIPVIDPATGAEVASVADANRADVDKAVAAAREAFEHDETTVLPVLRHGNRGGTRCGRRGRRAKRRRPPYARLRSPIRIRADARAT